MGTYAGSAKNASAHASGSWSGAACRLKIGIRMARAATKIPALTKPHLRAPRPVVWSSRGGDENRQDEKDEGSDKTWNQLPTRQASLPKGPKAGESECADVGVESRDPSFDHKITRGEKHRADQNVIEASPQPREVSTTACEDQTE